MIERICMAEKGQELMLGIAVSAAVVSFWRGIWLIMDLFLFPHNPHVSSFSSTIIGLAVIIFAHKVTKKLI